MKKIITCILPIVFCLFVKSQTIAPVTSGVYCGNVSTTFTVTMPLASYANVTATGTANTGISGSNAVQGIGAVSVTSNSVNTFFTFTGNFEDHSTPQGIIVSYQDASGTQFSNTFTYTKIASFNDGDNTSLPHPSPSSIQATACQTQNFNISFPTVTYVDNFVTQPGTTYGTVTSYQYLLPAGWQMGGLVSDGTTWITGTNNVTVTSDLTHGGSIQVRGAPCSASNTPGPAASISISRPLPTYTVSGSTTLCSGTSTSYTINGLQAGSTVSWAVNTPGIVSVDAPTSLSTTLTQTGSGPVNLTATITDACGNISTATLGNIVVGGPATPVILSTTYSGDAFLATSTFIVGASYNWFLNGVEESSHGYTLTDIVDCGVSNTLSVEAFNTCGTSALSHAIKIDIACGGGGQRLIGQSDSAVVNIQNHIVLTPNPGQGVFKVSAGSEVTSKIYHIRVIDALGRIRARFDYPAGINEVNLNLGKLSNGVYTLQTFSNASWNSLPLLILK